ncbi:MAG: Ig domain-containing protein [Trueperaceae bacterium]|nr:Ig domain-containing protein [Trueperaceae bacterium]
MPPWKRFRARSRERRSAARLTAVAMVLALLAACGGEAPLPGDPLRIASARLSDPVLGEPYRADVVAVGGLRPYDLRLEEGTLPPGIALQSGVLVGTPTELGRFEFTIAVSDANLASTFETFTLSVRDVPVPRLQLAVPDTEVRDTTVLRGRIEDARKLRAVRLRLRWGDLGLTLPDDAVSASRSDVALFWEPLPDGVAIDLAVLGEPYTGSGELFQLAVTTDEATRLGFDMTVEMLYSDRHTYDTRRLGGSPGPANPVADAEDGGAIPDDDAPGETTTDPNDEDPNDQDPNDGDTSDPETGDSETGTP